MTLKEFNKLRADIFSAAMNIPDVADAVRTSGVAYIYDLFQLPGKHQVVVLSAQTQMHDNLMRERGFDPEQTTAALKLVLYGQTKCAGL